MIAPAAENHGTPRRLVILIATAGLALLCALYPQIREETVLSLVFVILVPATLVTCSEPFILVPSVCVKFLRKGLPGQIAGRFFYPGWPSGVLFCGVLTILMWLLLLLREQSYSSDIVLVMSIMTGTLFFPNLILGMIPRSKANRFGFYLLVLVSSLLVAAVVAVIRDSSDSILVPWLFCWIPPVQMVLISAWGVDREAVILASAGIALIYLLLAMMRAAMQNGEIRKVEEAAREIGKA